MQWDYCHLVWFECYCHHCPSRQLPLHTLQQQRISIDSSEEDNSITEGLLIFPQQECKEWHTGSCLDSLTGLRRQWTCLSIVGLLGWFTAAHQAACAAAQCHVCGDITDASFYTRGCDGGSTSLCGSWLNRCSKQDCAQHHRHHVSMAFHPVTSCLTNVAECTIHTSCMFSYRTQLTGILCFIWFILVLIQEHCRQSLPFPFGVMSSLSISLCVTEDGMQI